MVQRTVPMQVSYMYSSALFDCFSLAVFKLAIITVPLTSMLIGLMAFDW